MERRAALVGCGARARRHAAAYTGVRGAQLVACCDRDAGRLQSLADEYGLAGRYTDLDALLAAERPDLVHVVTRPDVRVPLLDRLAAAGVPAVLVEKPVCVEVRDYLALRRLAATATTRFVVNLQLRHHRRVLEYLADIAAGAIGEVRCLDASSALPVAGQGVHVLDLLWAFAGYPPLERVVATGWGYDDIDGTHPSPRAMSAQLTFANGVRGLFHAGAGAPIDEPDPASWKHKRVAVYGTHGYRHWWMYGWEQSAPDGTLRRGQSDYAADDEQAQVALTEAALAWLEDETAVPPTNLTTALDEWLIILASYASIVERRPIEFPFEPAEDLLERYRATAGKGTP